ncbi:AAA family ATPase [Trichocoleus sp. FACHB-262]|uniref:AAA family ATPase n=1 Tax=Trichocoleus sp. FACHB-262 TaxID=2692869 RepID=UPI001684531E|nr:AAA family ATPase [Trichocoleus sp. FACHB-262]MBD2120744.1 adenylate kinase [Trichocoleus sp. FACHB-262]
MQRISVVGTTGSGKTTLARHISQRLNIPHVELDALHWNPNWSESATDVFCSRVAEALSGDRWVVDGNYSEVRNLTWSSADTLVWLDLPFSTTFGRLLRRTVRRVVTQEELWSGNRETLTKALSQDSILLWLFRTYHKRRREYPVLLQQPEYAHLKIIHLRSPQVAQTWLKELG